MLKFSLIIMSVLVSMTSIAKEKIATQLPAKRITASSTSSSSQSSSMKVSTVVPSTSSKGYKASATMGMGNITSLGNETIKYTEFTPTLGRKISGVNTTLSVPFTFINGEVFNARTIGRPTLKGELPLEADLENTQVSGYAQIQLPFYDSSLGSDTPISGDAGRSWELALGSNGDYQIGTTPNHLVGGVEVSYNTVSKVTSSAGSADLEHNPAVRLRLGAERHMEKGRIGIAVRTLNELSNDRLKGNGQEARVNALDLSQGEIYGSYQLTAGTLLSASLVKGFKHSVDPLALPLTHHASDIADVALNLGVLQTF